MTVPRINVSKVIKSSRLSQSYTVYRKSGEWVSGRWEQSESSLQITGPVTVPGEKEILQIPEGDRVKGVMCFHSTDELYTTNENGTSDEILWRNNRYRIHAILPWMDFGYCKALGTRMEGETDATPQP